MRRNPREPLVRLIGGVLAAALCAGAAFFSGCAKTEPVTGTGFFFDTVVEASVYADSAAAGQAALDAVMDRFDQLEQRLSATVAGSDVDRLNDGAGTAVSLTEDGFRVLDRALYYAELSGGAFDPTVGPLISLWGIGTPLARVPGQEEIDAAKALTDYRKVSLDAGEQTAALGAGQAVDLGGIAKGYAADQARETLEEAGITTALLNLGGNVLVMGGKPDGSAWKIGLQDPLGATGTYIGILEITDGSAVTSGVYERYFTQDGRRYHHILDPATGCPAGKGLLSVTILAQSSMDADALSTAVFVLGPQDGLALVNRLDGVEAVFITEDKTVMLTEGLTGRFTLTDASYTLS